MSEGTAFWLAVCIVGAATVISLGSCTAKEAQYKKELLIECIKKGNTPRECANLQVNR